MKKRDPRDPRDPRTLDFMMRFAEVEVEAGLDVPSDSYTRYIVYKTYTFQRKETKKKKAKKKTKYLSVGFQLKPIQFPPAHSYSHIRTCNRPAAGNGDVYCSVWHRACSRRSASQQARWISWLMTKYWMKRESTRK